MKVVVAHNRYVSTQPSGENTMVDLELAQLPAAGVEVLPFIRSSDEIPTLPRLQKAALPLSPLYAGRAQRELRDLLRRERPDVVHLHNPYPLLSPWVVRTAHAAGVAVVQTVHNYRQVCVNGIFFRDGHICTDCVGRRLPVPAVAHACYRGSRAQSAVMATTLAVHRSTWLSVDRFVALTDVVAEHLQAYGVPADRIAVRPNSAPDPGPPAPPGEGLLFLGRLVEDKGVPLLLEAWSRGSAGPLRVAGDGPLRGLVEATPGVEYLGPLDRAGVRAALAGCAAVVVPSIWHDVLPTVILEALAAGRPVLGTALGGIPYLIGDAGWIVEPSPDALAAGLARAVVEAPGLAAAARARYLSTFHPGVAVAGLIDVLATAAATRPHRS